MSIFSKSRSTVSTRKKPREIEAISVWHPRNGKEDRVIVRFYDLNGKDQTLTPVKFFRSGLRGSNGYVLVQDELGNWMRVSFRMRDIQKYDPTVVPNKTFTSVE